MHWQNISKIVLPLPLQKSLPIAHLAHGMLVRLLAGLPVSEKLYCNSTPTATHCK